jgi:hypothetical protein
MPLIRPFSLVLLHFSYNVSNTDYLLFLSNRSLIILFYIIRNHIWKLGQQSRTPTCTWCWLRTYDCNIIIEPRETSAFDGAGCCIAMIVQKGGAGRATVQYNTRTEDYHQKGYENHLTYDLPV